MTPPAAPGPARPIRRKDRATPLSDAWDLLDRGEWGTLSTVGSDGQPYGVPLSYVVMDQSIYFHCAQGGHKIDNLDAAPRASFCVVGATQPVFVTNFSTWYESAIVFGSVRTVEDEDEKTRALYRLVEKYLPDHRDQAESAIRKSFGRTRVLALSIDHLTGKAKRPPSPGGPL